MGIDLCGKIEAFLSLMNRRFEPLLKGTYPFDIEAVHDTMENKANGSPTAKCGVDAAFPNLMGRISGLLICYLLEGKVKAEAIDSVAEAAGMVCQIGSLDTTAGSLAVQLAKAKKNMGYAKIGGLTRIGRKVASGLIIRGEKVFFSEG